MSKRKPLSEEQWLASTTANALLIYLQQHRLIAKVAGGKRKLRLFSVACCRACWHLFTNEDCKRAIEVGERAADGKASQVEVRDAAAIGDALVRSIQDYAIANPHYHHDAAMRLQFIRNQSMGSAASFTASQQLGVRGAEIVTLALTNLRCWESGEHIQKFEEVNRFHADLVRDIFGNPFRPVPLDPRWISSIVRDLARTIYDERLWERMPILGDALMDAGCDNSEVIAHCQERGPHARGCWLVDLLLGRE